MAPLRKWGIGIVGANAERGWARDAHLPALRAMEGVRIAAVSARDRQTAEAAAGSFGAARAFADSIALTRDPDVDLVVVTVKVPEHRAIVLSALEARKHVWCEWPLGRDVAEAREMELGAARAGVRVVVGLQATAAPAVTRAAELVAEGVIGRPQHLRVVSATVGWGRSCPPHYAYLQDRSNGATLATIAGGHTLAIAGAIVGEVTQVSACNSTFVPSVAIAGTDRSVERTCSDHLLVHARHASGCVSSIEIVGGEDMPLLFELTGSARKLSIRGGHPGGFQCGELSVHGPDGAALPLPPAFPNLSAQAANVAHLYRRFLDDLASSRRTVPDFTRARRLSQTLDAIETASDEGRAIVPRYDRDSF